MRKREAYAAARGISEMVHTYFAKYRESALHRGEIRLAALPEIEIIEAIINAGFWASLRREEGFTPRISLAYLPRTQADNPLVLKRPLPIDPAALTRVAPAVQRPGIHLGVWHERGELNIWGATSGVPPLCFVVEVSAPGLLVVKHHSGGETRKFINVAVLEGDQIKLVAESAPGLESPRLFQSLISFDTPDPATHSIIQLAINMRDHRHGASLLFVPAGTVSWQSSIMQPIQYAVSPPFRASAALAAVGELTAVD